ncbi:uncharacterized protein LOC114911105, partial [Tachysurus ichikawai]
MQQYPHDGCLSLRLEFPGSVAGVAESIDALVLVCPDPVMKGDANILVGTNTSVVKKLVEACRERVGHDFLHTLAVHPEIRNAYAQIIAVEERDDDDSRGTVLYLRSKPVKLPPGESTRVYGKLKYPTAPSGKTLLIDKPEESCFPEELLIAAEVQSTTVVQSKRIGVTIKNVSSRPVVIKRGMPIAHVFPVEVMSTVLKPKENSGPTKLNKHSFNFGDSPVSGEWKQRLTKKMLERKYVFSCDEFDVGCSKSTQHHIRLAEDKPFRERSRRLPPADIEDVRQHLEKLKELLQGCLPAASLKKINAGSNQERVVYKASDPFGSRWSDACEAAFKELKVRLTQAPVLVFANPQLPYVLHVDACCEGLGGVLYQDQGQGLKPVAFVSR